MRTLIVLLALLSAACGYPPPLPAPANRAEACARINGPNAIAGDQLCRIGGAPCYQTVPTHPVSCIVPAPGEQSVCLNGAPIVFPTRSCDLDPARCPAGWECRAYAHPTFGGATRWCFPGPPCDSTADAGVDGG